MDVRNKLRSFLVVASFGGLALVTTVTCDPARGTLDLFRDDDDHVVDVFFEGEIVIVEECFGFFGCF